MPINRRQFLGAAGAAVATTAAGCGNQGDASPTLSDVASVRESFPRAVQQVYLDCASHTPLSMHTRQGMEKYMDFHMYGAGEGRGEYAGEAMRSVKGQFAHLIGAKPSEIAFVQKKLNNPKFVERAPEAVVAKQRAKLDEYVAARKALEEGLGAL